METTTAHKRVDIRRNDTVKVLSGRDKGKQGRVLRVFPDTGRVLVEHVMLVKKHLRPTQKSKGGIAEQESSVSISKVQLLCSTCGRVLMKEFELKNPMAVPHLHKIVVNMGMGEATQNAKVLDPAVNELGQITGQKPVVTRAKKSIAAFKVREGMPIGAMVTLRGDRMYEFFDRLVNIVLPRVRDFRGVSTKSFDGRGNYTLGLHDQLIFPEIDYAKVDKLKGMNVTIVTTARSDEQARALLRHLGMPFRP